MNARSDFKQALLTMLALLVPVAIFVAAAPTEKAGSLKPPDKEQIPVAFLISDGAVVIDFCGPWEVFQDVMIPSRQDMPFHLYTVAETKKPIRTSGGMQIVPDYRQPTSPCRFAPVRLFWRKPGCSMASRRPRIMARSDVSR